LTVVRETVSKYIEVFTDKTTYLRKFTKSGQLSAKLKELRNEEEKLKYKQSENARCIANLYGDFKKGLIGMEDFAVFREKYKTDNDSIDKRLENIEKEIKRYSDNENTYVDFSEKTKKLRDCLDNDYKLMTLVDKIEVFSKEKLKIHFNFLDEFEELLEYDNSDVTGL